MDREKIIEQLSILRLDINPFNEDTKPTYEALSSAIEAFVKLDKSILTLTKKEAYAIANHIDYTLIESIRNDPDCDSLTWLRNLIHGYEKLCEFSGYVGVTETKKEDEESERIYYESD